MPESGATNWPAADTFQTPASPAAVPLADDGDTTRTHDHWHADIGAAWEAMRTDSRWTNGRAPTGSAGGDLTGSYPNPTLAVPRVAKTGDTMTGELVVPDVSLTGITGAVTPTRHVGGTAGGPPATGTFVTGDFVVTTIGNLWVCTAGGSPGTWVPVGAGGFVRKTADETVTSSSALQDDDHLFLALLASSTYIFELVAFYDGATTGDIRIGFTVPSGSTIQYGVDALISTAAAVAGSINRMVISASGSSSGPVGAVGAGSKLMLRLSGLVVVAGTPGNLQVQWAQGTSDGTATTMFTNSYLTARRVA